VYLHAGGFYSVTERSDWAGPQYFMDQDIVLVTINYRLGSLGFISTGRDAPGNNGLKDQVVALRWIRDNIESFGGDSGSVTLFGYSAGSWSITLHLVSPMSRGLFHKAIFGSGSTLGQWSLPTNQFELAQKQARLVGCPDVSPSVMLQCLRSIPAEVLGNSLPDFAVGLPPKRNFFVNVMTFRSSVTVRFPVIEEDFGQERFLPDDPIKLIQNGDFQEVPVVIGVTKDEFANRAFRRCAPSARTHRFTMSGFSRGRKRHSARGVERKLRNFRSRLFSQRARHGQIERDQRSCQRFLFGGRDPKQRLSVGSN
jgi:carboxylesterase type B